MFKNPEFMRNLWLELSVHRLIATPVMLALVFFIILQNDGGESMAMYVAGTIFGLATIIWGAYLAYASLVGEIQHRTWDNQRMSALSPFKLVWGKLFGATSFAWYIGFPCLLVMLILPQANQNISNYVIVTNFVLGALLSQALAFVVALMSVNAKVNAPKGLSLLFLVYVGSSILLPLMFASSTDSVTWYSMDCGVRSLTVISLFVLTIWTWLSSYRVMQNVLQIKTIPWAMLSFILFLSVYLVGFTAGGDQHNNVFNVLLLTVFFAAFMAMAFVYIGAMTELRDLVGMQRFLNAWKSRNMRYALKETPYFIVLIVFSFTTVVCLSFVDVSALLIKSSHKVLQNSAFAGMGLIYFIMMLRDIGLLYYFSFGKKPQRAVWTTLAYLVLLYFIVPMLLPALRDFMLPQMITFGGSTMLGVVAALVHLLIIGGLLTYQQKSR